MPKRKRHVPAVPPAELILDLVVAYEDEGLAVSGLAERHDLPPQAIVRWFDSLGIERRSQGEQARLSTFLRNGGTVAAFQNVLSRQAAAEEALQVRRAEAWAARVSRNMARTLFINEWVQSEMREVRQSRLWGGKRGRIMARHRMTRRAPPYIIDEMRAAGLLPGQPRGAHQRYWS